MRSSVVGLAVRRAKLLVVGEAGGADAGRAVEGVDLEAGVVGDDDFAGSVVGVVDGFEAGVAFEGGFVFGWGGDLFEVGEWGDGDVWLLRRRRSRGACRGWRWRCRGVIVYVIARISLVEAKKRNEGDDSPRDGAVGGDEGVRVWCRW